MKSIPVSLNYTASLRVENAPALHDTLSERLGSPDTCFIESPEHRGSLWALESPLPATADINQHFAWASELVSSHESFIAQLVASGVQVTLQLACDTNLDYALLGFDTHLFAPFVRAEVPIDFCVTTHPDQVA